MLGSMLAVQMEPAWDSVSLKINLKKKLKKKRPFKHTGAFVLVPESTHLVWVETVTLWALCIRMCDLPRSLGGGAHAGHICKGPEASHSP